MVNKKRQTTVACQDMGNAYPACSPQSTDTWVNGTEHTFVWNYNYPSYVTSNQLDLHLYYKQNYAYQNIKYWNNLTTSDGQLTVTVDDTWFPTQLEGTGNKSWTMFAYYLPAGTNASAELTNIYSQFPRPFNFTVIQEGNGDTSGGDGSTSSSTNSNGNDGNLNGDANGAGLPGWSIAVIVIACVLFVTLLAVLGWLFFYLRRRKRSKLTPNMTETAFRSAAAGGAAGVAGAVAGAHKDNASIHSSTPIVARTSPRHSGTASTASSSRPTTSYYNADTIRSTSTANPTTTNSPFAALAEWGKLPEDEEQDEWRRRRLGEALLQRELAEEGANVKQAEHRPMTVQTAAAPELESRAVVLERNDDDKPSDP